MLKTLDVLIGLTVIMLVLSMGVTMLSLSVVSARSSPAGQTFDCLECLHGHAECEKDAQHPYDGERALDLQGHRNRRQCRTPQRLSQANSKKITNKPSTRHLRVEPSGLVAAPCYK